MSSLVDNSIYELCKFCDHFVEENDPEYVKEMLAEGITLCTYLHLEDGEQEFNHDATPSGVIHTGEEWKKIRPDLFKEHPDGNIGPNSRYHSRRGKDQ